MSKPTSQYPAAAAHLSNCLRASYVLGRGCVRVALKKYDISRLAKLGRVRSPYPFASHFRMTPPSLTKTQEKSRAGWGAVEIPAEMSMMIVGVRNFETSPPPVAVHLEVP